jgi:hypothetical protein
MAVIVCTLLFGPAQGALAQVVTADEARLVAENWIDLVEYNEGDWGGEEFASVREVEELMRGDRIVGYFFQVEPQGYIVVSLRRELAPIKVYSQTCDLDPASDEGMADVIKLQMERILVAIEQELGPVESVRSEDLREFLYIDYSSSWDELESGARINYQEGDILLDTVWNQGTPYNDQCPNLGCAWPPCNYNTDALVGCVALGGAQVMRHWNWPPYGAGTGFTDTYDWANMPDVFPECTSPPADWDATEVAAVAELCAESGDAVSMSYGCGSSGSMTTEWLDAYPDHFYYSDDVRQEDRDNYANPVDWYNLLKAQFNLNRPVNIGIPGHSFVIDGWQETGAGPTRWYHMNYGYFDSSSNAWYTLDAHPGHDYGYDYVVLDVYPATALGMWATGSYPRTLGLNHRYFDRDCTGTGGGATFDAGQSLQLLHDITVTGTAASPITFNGTTVYNTLIFSRGDRETGIKIVDGALRLSGASIRFH